MKLRFLLLALGMGLLATPVLAQESGPSPLPDPELPGIRLEFEYGKYAVALQRAQERIDRGGLSNDDLIELHRYAGLAAFNLGMMKEAERHLGALLRLAPDTSLDPFIVPPPAMEYFEKLRKQGGPELEALRQERKARRVQQQQLEAERERARLEAEEQRRRLEELSRKITVRVVEKHSFLMNFVPFGMGQFQQDRTTLGVVLASSEGALAAASVIGYIAHESLYQAGSITLDDRQVPGGTTTLSYWGIPRERAGEAQAWRLVTVLGGAGFYVLWGYGVIDALFHHQDESVTTHVEDVSSSPQSAAPTPVPHLSQRLAPRREGSLSAYVLPYPGGLGAGLRLDF